MQTIFWWQGSGRPLPEEQFDLALSVSTNDFRGNTQVQITWLDARESEKGSVQVDSTSVIDIHDYRTSQEPEQALAELIGSGDVRVWAEKEHPLSAHALSRWELFPGDALIVWTIPPGPEEFDGALTATQPRNVYVFAQDPGLADAPVFLNHLAGLAKHALHRQGGSFSVEDAAAAMAHRPTTVVAGLEWLEVKGQIVIEQREGLTWTLAQGAGNASQAKVRQARLHLDQLLAETQAYRDYWRQAPAHGLK
jgi:hypothetical protein